MSCPMWKEKLVDHAAGELPAEEALLLEEHLCACEACRREIGALESVLACRGAEEEADLTPLAHRIFARASIVAAPSATRRPYVGPPAARGLAALLSAWLRRPLPAYAALGLVLLAAAAGAWTARFEPGGHGERTPEATLPHQQEPADWIAPRSPDQAAPAPEAAPRGHDGPLPAADASRPALADASYHTDQDSAAGGFVIAESDAVRLEIPTGADSL